MGGGFEIGEGGGNFLEKVPSPFPKPHPSLSKDFRLYRIPVRSFSSADDLGMVRLSKGMPASRVRGSNEGRESAIRRALFFQLMPERTPFAPPPHFMKVLGGGGGTRAPLVGLVGGGSLS